MYYATNLIKRANDRRKANFIITYACSTESNVLNIVIWIVNIQDFTFPSTINLTCKCLSQSFILNMLYCYFTYGLIEFDQSK